MNPCAYICVTSCVRLSVTVTSCFLPMLETRAHRYLFCFLIFRWGGFGSHRCHLVDFVMACIKWGNTTGNDALVSRTSARRSMRPQLRSNTQNTSHIYIHTGYCTSTVHNIINNYGAVANIQRKKQVLPNNCLFKFACLCWSITLKTDDLGLSVVQLLLAGGPFC